MNWTLFESEACSVGGPVKRTENQATDWEETSANWASNKGLYLNYIKNSQNTTVKTHPIRSENGRKR